MKLQLKEWKVKNVLFNITDEDISNKKKKNSFDLSVGNFLPEGKDNEFGIGFQVDLINKDYTLNVEMVFLFKSSDKLPEDYKSSPFIKINAPAIAFPYLRAFISNLTLQSGFSPAMLPSVNFVELKKKNDPK